jgi:hypothetical protein
MRFSKFIGLSSLGIIFFSGLLFTSCGSFKSGSYYSDGIYNSDNVIVIRRNKKTPATNAYTQYFDQQANQYNWDNNTDSVALTNVDSLNQGFSNNYQSNPNWGGGNKTTQIIIQSTPLNFGFGGNWGFGGFYDPYVAYWDYNFYNPYRWNRFAWGFNRPFFNGFFPYYGYGFYGNPYFYGGGFWNGYGYAYNNPYRRPFNRFNNNRRNDIRRNRAYSSTYRGQAAAAGVGRTAVNTRAQRNNNGTSASLTNENSRSSRQSNSAGTATAQTQQGRTASVRQSQNLDDTESRVRRTQSNRETQNRSQIDRVMRQMQANGFDIQVINTTEQARRYQLQNQARNVVNQGGRSNRQAVSRNNSNNSTKEYSSSRNYSNSSSTRSSSSNARSSSSRSYSAPVRVSSGAGRSSSSGRSSSGRSSSGGRRQ